MHFSRSVLSGITSAKKTRSKTSHLTATMAISLTLVSCAQTPTSNDAGRLMSTTTFALGQVGFIGQTSEGERRYRTVLQSEDALKTFKLILVSPDASTEARLYAACGIHQLIPVDFDTLTQDLRRSGLSASVLRTDILNREPVSYLLERIGKYGCEPILPMT